MIPSPMPSLSTWVRPVYTGSARGTRSGAAAEGGKRDQDKQPRTEGDHARRFRRGDVGRGKQAVPEGKRERLKRPVDGLLVIAVPGEIECHPGTGHLIGPNRLGGKQTGIVGCRSAGVGGRTGQKGEAGFPRTVLEAE